jgi:hypothetical protein
MSKSGLNRPTILDDNFKGEQMICIGALGMSAYGAKRTLGW